MSIKNSISKDDCKKVFRNKENRKEYLDKLGKITNKDLSVKRGKDYTNRLDDVIIETWDYEISKEIIREMFMKMPKFIRGKDCKKLFENEKSEWVKNNMGDFEWPFAPSEFDQHSFDLLKRNNTEDSIEILKKEVEKFVRMKALTTTRNDYIEYLIVRDHKEIIPTLNHSNGVDFYINGERYDQKVSKSVGKEFIKKYGKNYKKIMKDHPELLAKSLYENQSEARFNDTPRLYIVYSNNDMTLDGIEGKLKSSNLSKPMKIEFEFNHSKKVIEKHKTSCFTVIL